MSSVETSFSEQASRFWMRATQRTEANRLTLEGIKSIPKTMIVTFWAVDWFNAVSQFRTEECNFLCEEGLFEANLDSHRAAITGLIFQGETLVLAAKQNGPVQDSGFTLDDIRAAIECLRETFRGVYGLTIIRRRIRKYLVFWKRRESQSKNRGNSGILV
jgi:hypothetical protein